MNDILKRIMNLGEIKIFSADINFFVCIDIENEQYCVYRCAAYRIFLQEHLSIWTSV